MGTSLYKISNDYIELMNTLEDLEGELTPELEKALAINEANLQVKAKGYVEIIKTKEALDMAIDIEIKRLQGLKNRNSNVITELKNRLLVAVRLFGDFEIGLVKFTTRKSQTLNVTDANLIPNEYKVRTVTESVQKVQLKKAINEGAKIEGAEVVDNYNLSIK